jgi:DNA-directed RNA polymerase specialized sigma24 family protein
MREFLAVLPDAPASSLPFSELREQYQQGHLSRKDFEGRIFQFLLKNHQRFNLFKHNQDTFSDYLAWLYPRLSRAIDSYKDLGSSFDAYICSIVHWSAKEYQSREADHHVTEYACWEARAEEESAANEGASVYRDTEENFKPVSNPRQVLVLLLKSYFFVSDDFITRVAPALCVSPEALTGMVDKLRELRADRETEIRDLQEQLHVQYYRSVAYQKQLESIPEGAARLETMNGRLERARARYANIKQRLATINREPSNSQIATVMGIPKGTVDSTLYAIKQKARRGVYQLADSSQGT